MHVKALPGRPYDGHTLRMVLPKIERLTGARLKRVYVDDGYRGHGLAPGFPRQPEAERDAGHPAGAAAGCNFRLLLNWIITILLALLQLAFANYRSHVPKPTGA